MILIVIVLINRRSCKIWVIIFYHNLRSFTLKCCVYQSMFAIIILRTLRIEGIIIKGKVFIMMHYLILLCNVLKLISVNLCSSSCRANKRALEFRGTMEKSSSSQFFILDLCLSVRINGINSIAVGCRG